MKIKVLFLLVLLLSFGACVYDPPTPYIEIENRSGEQVTLELHFDNDKYKHYWSRSDFETFLTNPYGYSHPGPETELVSTDQTDLTQQYLMPDSSVFIIHDGWGDRNEDVLYTSLKVFRKSDTLSFDSVGAMKRSFQRVDKYCSKLLIN